MDLCLTNIPDPKDRRPVWISTAMAVRQWSTLIAQPKFEGVRGDAEYAYAAFDAAGAYVPVVAWAKDVLKMEWREEGKYFVLFLEHLAVPRWASGRDDEIVEVQFARDLPKVVDAHARWLSPPRPKKVVSVGN